MGKDAAPAAEPNTAQGAPTAGDSQPPALPDLDRATLLALLDRNAEDPDFRKELRSRRAVAGIAGEIAQGLRKEDETRAQREAAEAREQELLRMAAEDPVGFAQKFQVDYEAQRTQKEAAEMRTNLRKEFGERIGNAIWSIPEAKELTQDEMAQITASLANLPEDEVLGAFTSASVKALSHRLALKLHAEWKAKDLAKELAAAKKADNAARLKSQTAPSMARSGGGAVEPKFDPTPGSAWNKWYDKTFLNKRTA